ncbi:DUF262 domain-containing protein [Dactylosporangium sp. CA-139114]|uniref:DUF262 domain-containing protein n=1 Tax=Dactylosporangium sp. CA-139114 TaxID=3239931 RepID=UPI003D98C808
MPQDDFLRYEASGIAALLRTRSLAVPYYQRAYSWRTAEEPLPGASTSGEKLQVVDYWNDLRTSFYDKTSYFLGTVVLARGGDEGRQLVIDGQQRLVTTSLLLASIRNRFLDEGEKDFAQSTQQDYLGKFDRKVGADRPKLILNTDDRAFYESHIVKSETFAPLNVSQRLIADAYGYLSERVQEFVGSHGTGWRQKLNELVDWLDTGAQIVAIDVASEADAFLIFETLNDRGADLTVADLLKNYLFKQSGSRLDEVQNNWTSTLTNLDIDKVGNQRFTSFARHLLSSRHGRVRERDVYGRMKAVVSDPVSAVSFSQDLKDSSRAYDAIITPESDYWADYPSSVGSAAEVLVELNLEQYRPLMLAVLATFPKKEITRFVPTMVSWAIRGLCAGTLGAGSAETAFCEAAKSVRSGATSSTEGILADTKVGALVPTDGEFQNTFKVWKVVRAPVARYILRAMELEVIGDREPELVVNDDADQVNLEHIFPKSAKTADWPQFTPDDRRTFVHRIGNLCLLRRGPNGRIGNKSWNIKQPILAASALQLTKKAADFSVWTRASIEARQRELAEIAVRTWPRLPRS